MQNIKIRPIHPRRGYWKLGAALVVMFLTAPVTPGHGAEATDVDKLDIDGFRLGMTVEEAAEKWPDLKIREVVREKAHVGFQAHRSEVHVSFTSKELGSKVFQVQLVRVFHEKPNSFPIYQRLKRKYGRPDYGGRQMMNINACWGKCYGDNKRLEFSMSIVGFGNKPFPMTLTLSDRRLEKENYNLFKARAKAKKP
ncbi:MAG: hypothetical protein OEZ04_01540 [Nitrospinota bacterium]|nr:hypothetical protein [Nitrospinota bacterium]